MNRQTKQREAILRFLRGTRSHPTADQVYDEVRHKTKAEAEKAEKEEHH